MWRIEEIDMANGNTHQLIAATVIAGAISATESRDGKQTATPLIGGALASVLTKLPDQLEPALHPNHRQFFHSIAVGALVGFAGYKAYTWEPESTWEQAVRFIAMVACGAYLVHLATDACTPKALPFIGKI